MLGMGLFCLLQMEMGPILHRSLKITSRNHQLCRMSGQGLIEKLLSIHCPMNIKTKLFMGTGHCHPGHCRSHAHCPDKIIFQTIFHYFVLYEFYMLTMIVFCVNEMTFVLSKGIFMDI